MLNHHVRTEPYSKPLAFWKALLIPFLLFGNNENGFWGNAETNPEGKRDFRTAWKLWLSNPLHNFFFHAIGFSDKQTEMWWSPYIPAFANVRGVILSAHVIRPVNFSWQRMVLGLLYVGTATYLFRHHSIFLLPWLAFIPGLVMIFASFKMVGFPYILYSSSETLVEELRFGWDSIGAFVFKLRFNRTVASAKHPRFLKVLQFFKP